MKWSDAPSSAGDQFFYGTSQGNLNQQSTPVQHSVFLTGLTPYTKYYYEINAYQSCYTSAQSYGSFTPYDLHSISIDFLVSNASGYAQISRNSADFSNGSTMYLCSPITIYLSAYVDTAHSKSPFNYAFIHWLTTIGTFSSQTGLMDEFTLFTAATSGTMVELLNETTDGWAGVQYHHTGSRYVNATITLPKTAQYLNNDAAYYPCAPSMLSMWVGLGGNYRVGQGSGFLQAGIDIVYNNSNPSTTPWIYMFVINAIALPGSNTPVYEELDSEGEWLWSGSPACSFGSQPQSWDQDFPHTTTGQYYSEYSCGQQGSVGSATMGPDANFAPKLGDRVSVNLSYWNITSPRTSGPYAGDRGPMANFSFVDLSQNTQQGHPYWRNQGTPYSVCLPFAVDTNYAEVISEQPQRLSGLPTYLTASSGGDSFDNITFISRSNPVATSFDDYLWDNSCVAFDAAYHNQNPNDYWITWQTPSVPSLARLQFSVSYYSLDPVPGYPPNCEYFP